MPRLTLRTLLAYIDDTLEPHQARALGRKVAASPEAKQLIERIKKVTRRRRLHAPIPDGTEDDVSDPNTVAEYLSDTLDSDQLKPYELTCLNSDVHLAEAAACHQILTLVMTEPVRVPPTANQRMYKLVEPPASDPNRKPGKGLPVAGATPPLADHPDGDEPDAALLLGMKRYSASDSWAGRLGLVGAVAVMSLLLVVAVMMALPQKPPAAPESSRDFAYRTTPAPSGKPTAPDPKPTEPKDDPKTEPKTEPKTDPKVDPMVEPKGDPGPVLGDVVKPPLQGRELVGKLETPNVLVLTRGPDPAAPWLHADPNDPGLFSGESVMALPGYKADVRLATDVVVHLWGHVPEQVPFEDLRQVMTRLRILESRVRFHPPPQGFAADLTLEAGRVYLTTLRPTGAKIRVRIASEVWDVTLSNDKAEVMVQANTAYTPGTPLAREGGEKPRTDARLAVTRGSARVVCPGRFKKFDSLSAGMEMTWDSKTNLVTEPRPYPKGDPLTERDGMLLQADYGRAVQKALSDTATRLSARDGVRVLLEGRINSPDLAFLSKPVDIAVAVNAVRFAIYAYAAIADGSEAPAILGNLYDQLANAERGFARQAAVSAVSAWIGRDPGNTAILFSVMTSRKRLPEDVADHILRLLRGYSSEAAGDTNAVDALIKDLDDDNIVIREAALANLIAFFDPEANNVPALIQFNVAARGQAGYEAGLKRWRERGEEIKKRMIDRKMMEKK